MATVWTLPRAKRPTAAVSAALNRCYAELNRAEYISPDPLAPVRRYADPQDQEIVGLTTSSLAFGNVKTILTSCERVLSMFPKPADSIDSMLRSERSACLAGFRHRYVTGADVADMLHGAAAIRREHGTLGRAFQACIAPEDTNVLPALSRFTNLFRAHSSQPKNYLIADPARGSACKRLLMYLRWMVRRDAVDPGPWRHVPESMLVVPMDTHMHRISRALGFTKRNTADLRAALEVTAAFRRVAPDDPVKFDFALTRLGIRREMNADAFLAACNRRPAQCA